MTPPTKKKATQNICNEGCKKIKLRWTLSILQYVHTARGPSTRMFAYYRWLAQAGRQAGSTACACRFSCSACHTKRNRQLTFSRASHPHPRRPHEGKALETTKIAWTSTAFAPGKVHLFPTDAALALLYNTHQSSRGLRSCGVFEMPQHER